MGVLERDISVLLIGNMTGWPKAFLSFLLILWFYTQGTMTIIIVTPSSGQKFFIMNVKNSVELASLRKRLSNFTTLPRSKWDKQLEVVDCLDMVFLP